MSVMAFDLNPARRPTVSDVGGATKTDGPVKPDPVTMLTSDQENQGELLVAGMGGVCPLAIVVVTQAAGVYSIASVRAPGSNINAGTFTVTKNGTGDVTLSWATGALPGTVAPLESLQQGGGAYGSEITLPTGTSIRIRIKDNSATAQESNFCVWIF